MTASFIIAIMAIVFDPYILPPSPPVVGGQYINIRSTPFLAKGDGVIDDTDAFQSAINVFSDTVGSTGSLAKNGTIYCPGGQYKVSSTLNIVGNSGVSINLMGDSRDGSGNHGTDILWFGAAGGVICHTFGLSQSTWQNINFVGGPPAGANRPLYCLQVDTNQPAGGAASTGNAFWRCGFSGWGGAGSAGVAAGRVSNTQQVSELDFIGCAFQGDSSQAQAGSGFLVLGGGNQKNFKFFGGTLNGTDYGIDWLNASGSLLLSGVIGANIKVAFVRVGAGTATIQGCEVETGFNEAKLVTGTGGVNSNASGVFLSGNAFFGASALANAVAVDHFGPITLIGNMFQMGPAIPQIQTDSQGNTGEIISLGNYYRLASVKADFRDYSGNDINLSTQPVMSLGDRANSGAGGSGPVTRLAKTIGI